MEHLHDEAPQWVTGGVAGIAIGTVAIEPRRITFLVGSAVEMLRKLEYEVSIFNHAHHANPPDITGIVYAALNVALAGQAMYDWVKADIQTRDGTAFDRAAFDENVGKRLGPYHEMCRQMANTLKHASYRGNPLGDGRVKMDYLPGDEHISPLAVLLLDAGDGNWIDALSWTGLIASGWRLFLMDGGLLSDPANDVVSENFR
ncbi:hypothetical protein [Sphingobium sp. CAP-1]|uniref:hypothetical protein n=1 Tax=Sphingobium sp. CAP-1 TaxID=2676077 RepID=UPI0012BB3785|nr:hypothetical protein [Sphingobium sp. CAP-1]QGP80700.1 hypothetical protein GL174_16495 [Sphingobium sp. CAP-1]